MTHRDLRLSGLSGGIGGRDWTSAVLMDAELLPSGLEKFQYWSVSESSKERFRTSSG